MNNDNTTVNQSEFDNHYHSCILECWTLRVDGAESNGNFIYSILGFNSHRPVCDSKGQPIAIGVKCVMQCRGRNKPGRVGMGFWDSRDGKPYPVLVWCDEV